MAGSSCIDDQPQKIDERQAEKLIRGFTLSQSESGPQKRPSCLRIGIGITLHVLLLYRPYTVNQRREKDVTFVRRWRHLQPGCSLSALDVKATTCVDGNLRTEESVSATGQEGPYG